MPTKPARALPSLAPAHVPLDALLARAGATPQPHTARRPRFAPSAPSAPRQASAERPTALILPISIMTCTGCGSITRAPGNHVLAQYSPNEHSVRYSSTGIADCDGLPHRLLERHVEIPFCEECF